MGLAWMIAEGAVKASFTLAPVSTPEIVPISDFSLFGRILVLPRRDGVEKNFGDLAHSYIRQAAYMCRMATSPLEHDHRRSAGYPSRRDHAGAWSLPDRAPFSCAPPPHRIQVSVQRAQRLP